MQANEERRYLLLIDRQTKALEDIAKQLKKLNENSQPKIEQDKTIETDIQAHLEFEFAASKLYDSWWVKPGWVPWHPNGNSDMQEEARRQIRQQMEEARADAGT